nr:NAD(P)/FAD-dependent oxidoreductase [Candidatus Njordarchaeota archaeon]
MECPYDVLVVGAGPSGSCATLAATDKGVKTLLIDRRSEIGDNNHCGELLPTPKEMRDLLPRADEVEKLVDVPPRLVMGRTRLLRLISPRGTSWEFPFESNVIDRRGFEKHLVIEASRHGADIMPSTKAVGMLDGQRGILAVRRGERIEIQSSITIGCDGVGSRVAKWAGLDSKVSSRDFIVGVQFEMTRVEVENDVVEMYFGAKVAPGGYAWIIPKGDDVANVGLGVRTVFSERRVPVMEYLRRFINIHKVSSEKLSKGTPVAFRRGFIPVGGPIDRTFNGNILVAGDAGGFVMAANGGGMPPGMVSGKIAGEVAASHLNEGVEISQYEKEWHHQIGKELKNALVIRRLVDKTMVSDEKMDSLMNRLGAEYMRELIKCRLPLTLKVGTKALRF